eukprot:TRINITY_DN9355_c0_g1_i3.p1 TRINITY_DN9355_c0_g1~~TRINITY_DN9355_c0_g1_i3.p1  ORF type:complete len:337 (+),score=69.10 TRINITY_DN9355_c0_g1_i3:55-1065(+)
MSRRETSMENFFAQMFPQRLLKRKIEKESHWKVKEKRFIPSVAITKHPLAKQLFSEDKTQISSSCQIQIGSTIAICALITSDANSISKTKDSPSIELYLESMSLMHLPHGCYGADKIEERISSVTSLLSRNSICQELFSKRAWSEKDKLVVDVIAYDGYLAQSAFLSICSTALLLYHEEGIEGVSLSPDIFIVTKGYVSNDQDGDDFIYFPSALEETVCNAIVDDVLNIDLIQEHAWRTMYQQIISQIDSCIKTPSASDETTGTDGPEFVHQDKAPQELQHSEQIQFDQDPKNMMEGTEPEVDDLPTGEGLNHSCDQLQMETFELTDSEDESENEE